jgi:hypothetical protein
VLPPSAAMLVLGSAKVRRATKVCICASTAARMFLAISSVVVTVSWDTPTTAQDRRVGAMTAALVKQTRAEASGGPRPLGRSRGAGCVDVLRFDDRPDGSAVAPRDRLEEVLQRYHPYDPEHRAVHSARGELLATVERVHTWI